MKALILFTGLLFLVACDNSSKCYRVRIVYCDTRRDDTVVLRAFREPSNRDIDSYKEAMPIFSPDWMQANKWINVCEVHTLNETIPERE